MVSKCLAAPLARVLLTLVAPLVAVSAWFAMALGKYAEPRIGDQTDTGKFKKLAHRVEETLSSQCLFDTPKQIPPPLVLVAPCNRMGAPPNVPHIHKGLLQSFRVKGFDRNKAAIGICIQHTSDEGKRKTTMELPIMPPGPARNQQGTARIDNVQPGAGRGSTQAGPN